MTNEEFLTYDAEAGAEVLVQETNTMEFYEGYVDDDGYVRTTYNGAIFSDEHHMVVG